jgi:hypothetical protein
MPEILRTLERILEQASKKKKSKSKKDCNFQLELHQRPVILKLNIAGNSPTNRRRKSRRNYLCDIRERMFLQFNNFAYLSTIVGKISRNMTKLRKNS